MRTHGQLMLPIRILDRVMLPPGSCAITDATLETDSSPLPAGRRVYFRVPRVANSWVKSHTIHLPGLRVLVARLPAFAFNSLALCCARSSSCFLPRPL